MPGLAVHNEVNNSENPGRPDQSGVSHHFRTVQSGNLNSLQHCFKNMQSYQGASLSYICDYSVRGQFEVHCGGFQAFVGISTSSSSY